MGTKIIMVRHGYSVSNDKKFFTGSLDIELTEKGREQAELCGEFFGVWSPCSACGEERKEKIWDLGIGAVDAIYSSDLCRAYETALPIAKTLGLEVEASRELREISAGKWEGMPFVDIDRVYAEDYAVWKNDIGRATCTGGESVKAFADRILREVQRIAQRHMGGAVVIVTHATPIRVISTVARGIEVEDMGRVPWVSNASISVFEYDGCFSEIKTNITSHLGNLKTDLPRGV